MSRIYHANSQIDWVASRIDHGKRFTLFGNRNSGHSYKVALMLMLAEVEYEYFHVNLDIERDDRPDKFRQITKFGEVPVLLHGEVAICQSNAILLYLARLLHRFAGENERDHSEIEQWLFWEANRIGFSLSNLRHIRRLGIAAPELEAYYESRARDDLDRLDSEFSDARKEFLIGDRFTIADIACCGYLFLAWQAKLDLNEWEGVANWLARIQTVRSWTAPLDLMSPA
ncbi:glutathione S-transferase family protein [Rhizobium mongolense]|uniref:glutathione S-transferase family protein n=1 Tax=Rhizobium mongolense TaxID=57676 RepID=UPI00355739E6